MTNAVVLPESVARVQVFWAAGDDAFFSPETVAAVLDLSKQTLSNWRVSGDGPKFVKRKSTVYYRKADVTAWLRSFTAWA